MKCNKTSYPNQRDADNVISKAWSGHKGWMGKRLPVRCYQCNDCKRWHLTSKPLMTREQLSQRATTNA